jgi:hypothetical protein
MSQVRKDIDMTLNDHMRMEDMEKDERDTLTNMMAQCNMLEARLESAEHEHQELVRQGDRVQIERSLRVRPLLMKLEPKHRAAI